jgi:hypothetical protein
MVCQYDVSAEHPDEYRPQCMSNAISAHDRHDMLKRIGFAIGKPLLAAASRKRYPGSPRANVASLLFIGRQVIPISFIYRIVLAIVRLQALGTMSSFSLNQSTIPTGLYIGGKWVAGRGERLDTLNPATEKVHGSVTTASPEDVHEAVKSAREAFETTWGLESSAMQRSELMSRLADLLEKNKDELAELEAIDCGKPVSCECEEGYATDELMIAIS